MADLDLPDDLTGEFIDLVEEACRIREVQEVAVHRGVGLDITVGRDHPFRLQRANGVRFDQLFIGLVA